MRLVATINPIFLEPETITKYRNNPRVREIHHAPRIRGSVHPVGDFFSASVHLTYPRAIDRPGDISEDNPHSTWILFAGVFARRTEALDWLVASTGEWSQTLGASPILPRIVGRSTDETRRNARMPRRARIISEEFAGLASYRDSIAELPSVFTNAVFTNAAQQSPRSRAEIESSWRAIQSNTSGQLISTTPGFIYSLEGGWTMETAQGTISDGEVRTVWDGSGQAQRGRAQRRINETVDDDPFS